MTEDPPTDTAEHGRKTSGRQLCIFGLVATVVLLAAVAGLVLTEHSTTARLADAEPGSTAPVQKGVSAGAVVDSQATYSENGAGEVQDPPDIVPPASQETPDEEDSPVERHENELVVTTLVLNSLLGLFVFAHRFAPGIVGRFLRPGKQHEDGTNDGTDESYDDELLDDCDVVIHLLEDNDGQLPQSEIVASTDWSKAKVSRLLGEMASGGDIVKIRLGRQNLVCLDGCEPELSKPLPPAPEDGRTTPHLNDDR